MLASLDRRRFGAMALGAAAAPGAAAAAAPAWSEAKAFDAYVRKAMTVEAIPGLSIAIVEGDAIKHLGAYGVTRMGASTSVAPDTRFEIGSTTKAFTALTVAQLVEQGRLRWDTRVADVMPWFEHHDPAVRGQLKVFDLLCAHYGVGVQTDSSMLFFASPATSRRELLMRARHLKPDYGFRERFAYSNVMYIAAGQLVEEITGRPWEAVVAEQIFAPAGMPAASFDQQAPSGADNSAPHAVVDGVLRPIRDDGLIKALAPTGGIIASGRDMAQWLKVQVAGGRVDGRVVASPSTIQRTHTLHTAITDPERDAAQLPFKAQLASNYWGYGLGWFLSEYQGEPMVWHSGGTSGFRAGVVLFPRRRFGVAVLANRQGTNVNFALALKAFDLRFGRKGPDWAALSRAAAPAPRPPLTTPAGTAGPSLPLTAFIGRYRDAGAFEPAVITADGPDALKVQMGRIAGRISPWRGDVLAVDWAAEGWTGRQFLRFDVEPERGPARFRMGVYGPFEREA